MAQEDEPKTYWRSVLRATGALGAVWALTTALASWLAPALPGSLAGFPLGYLLAAQGALLVFLAIVVVCAVWMGRIDERHARASVTANDPADDER